MSRKDSYANHADFDWTVVMEDDGKTIDQGMLTNVLLMDVRAQLYKLNALLHCSNFVAVPAVLRQICANTARKKRKMPVKKR